MKKYLLKFLSKIHKTEKIDKNKQTNTLKTKWKTKWKFTFSDWISFFENEYVIYGVILLYIIIAIILWKMYFSLYTWFKENYISINNLHYNINLLKENKQILSKNIKEIEKLRILEPKKLDYAQILYNIEMIIKNSAKYQDNHFFIQAYDYNNKKNTLKLKITWVEYYDGIKRIMFNLRKFKNYFDINNLKVKFISKIDKKTYKIIEYYNLDLDINVKWLF